MENLTKMKKLNLINVGSFNKALGHGKELINLGPTFISESKV